VQHTARGRPQIRGDCRLNHGLYSDSRRNEKKSRNQHKASFEITKIEASVNKNIRTLPDQKVGARDNRSCKINLRTPLRRKRTGHSERTATPQICRISFISWSSPPARQTRIRRREAKPFHWSYYAKVRKKKFHEALIMDRKHRSREEWIWTKQSRHSSPIQLFRC